MFGMVYLIIVLSGIAEDISAISTTTSKKSNLENDVLKTSIDVTMDSQPTPLTNFDFKLTNTNLKKLYDFANFDVIVTYDSLGSTYTEVLTYSSSCPAGLGEWCIVSWTDDRVDPLILNSDETITVRAQLNRALQDSSDLVLVVSTQNGVIDTYTTTVLGL